MAPDKIAEFAKRKPFCPFRLYLSDGTVHVVHHPDQIILDQRVCYIGFDADREGVFQRIATVSNTHITHLEPFDPERKSA
jgi:hypothetical protein